VSSLFLVLICSVVAVIILGALFFGLVLLLKLFKK